MRVDFDGAEVLPTMSNAGECQSCDDLFASSCCSPIFFTVEFFDCQSTSWSEGWAEIANLPSAANQVSATAREREVTKYVRALSFAFSAVRSASAFFSRYDVLIASRVLTPSASLAAS